MKLTIA